MTIFMSRRARDFKYQTDARLGVAAASAPDAAFDAATSSSMLAAG